MGEGVKGKEEFLKEFGKDYGYPDGTRGIDEIRASEFKRLNGERFASLRYGDSFIYYLPPLTLNLILLQIYR